MTYITEELKENFKNYLAEQSYIYDDNKQGLTHSYYWDYRDIIEPWLMKKLIENYGNYSTVKEALHQYALENDMFDYEEAKQYNTHAQTALSARLKAKENGNLPLADLLMDDWFKVDRKLQKILSDNALDIQSLEDRTTAPRFAYKLWTDDHSAVTGTGLGDGSYDCFIAKDGDQIVGIKIDYFYDEDEN